MDLDDLGRLLHPLPPPAGAHPDLLQNVQVRMRAPLGRRVPPWSSPPRGHGLVGNGLPAAAKADDNAPASNPPTMGGVLVGDAAMTTSSEGADGLLGRLDTLADSHGTLGREYETLLRMLQEARTELPDSQEKLRKQSEDQPKQQREQMEALVKNLEASYRG